MNKTIKRTIYIASAVIALSLHGCYSYDPAPKCIDSDNYTGVKKEIQQVIPKDCEFLTLEIAREIALVNNPDYIARHQSMIAARQRYYQSMSAYLPTVSSSYDAGQVFTNPTYQKNPGAASANRTGAFNQQVGLNAQWTIFDGLMRTMNMLVAKHQAKEYEYIEEDTRRILLESVANQYNNVLLAVENNRIAKTDMDFQQKLLDETQLKYDAGAVPLSDVLNFKVKFNDAEGKLIRSQYNYNTSKYALAALMGIPEAQIPDEVKFPPMSADTNINLVDVRIYIDTALSNRPDLKQYREVLLAAEYTLYSRWGAFSPTVTATGGLSWSRNKVTNNGRYGSSFEGSSQWDTSSRTNVGQYNINVSWTLFDGTRRFTRVREAQALVAQAEYDLTTQWIKVIQDVRAAYDNYIQSVKQAVIYKNTLGLVTQQRDLVEEEYKAGNTELTRLNEAQRDLVQADSNLVSSLINMQNAKAQLAAATNSR